MLTHDQTYSRPCANRARSRINIKHLCEEHREARFSLVSSLGVSYFTKRIILHDVVGYAPVSGGRRFPQRALTPENFVTNVSEGENVKSPRKGYTLDPVPTRPPF